MMTCASFGSFLSYDLKTASRKRAPATDDTETKSKPSTPNGKQLFDGNRPSAQGRSGMVQASLQK
jgi:hypothetical protein